LKIRTSSLPIFGTNETSAMISPPLFLPTELPTPPIESSININPISINDNKQIPEIVDSTNRIDQISSQVVNEEEKEKKKKKKKNIIIIIIINKIKKLK